MNRSSRLPELLAPAGSPEALRAAVAAGADAVYLGGSGFNARANAVNFDENAMAEAVAYCHAYGVKVYVTLNTLLYDRELEAFLSYAATLYRLGVDAVIVADRGAMRLLSRYIPALPVHASTQASAHSVAGVDDLVALGATRVVPARELSLADIRTVVAQSKAEIEVFLHGALCVSYSGQCLFSSLVGGRSGNRGECAQPCRLPYNGAYPISLKDLSLADHIPALIDSGVASLKIEGRMKSPAYVYGVTEIYRRLLDEGRAATREENHRLRELFSRGGFTDGYFVGRAGKPMTGTRSEQDKADSRALGELSFPERKIPLRGEVCIAEGQPAALTLSTADGRTAHVTGDIPAAAKNAPLTEEGLRDRLCRMGGTPFSLAPSDLCVTLSPGLNLSPGAINALRRAALASFTAPNEARATFALPQGAGRPVPAKQIEKPLRTALFYSHRQSDAIGEGLLYFDLFFLPLDEWERAMLPPSGVYIPPIVHDHELKEVLALLKKAYDAGIRYALCGNAGMVKAAKEIGFAVIGDFRLNVTNRESAAALREAGLFSCVLSPELAMPQLRDIGWGNAIVYGRIPLMLTERCFMKENFGCERCGNAALTDRRAVKFPMLREYPHRNLICNSLPTYMGDKRAALDAIAPIGEHFIFTIETEKEATRVLQAYRAGSPLAGEVRRIAAAPQKEKRT
ncbi:MAG: U32 family peptidase [Clostridia bacterium]|nr:U32 family peptidase [Clostridia bacterium]